MSDKNSLTTDRFVWREVKLKRTFIRYQRLKTQMHSLSVDLSGSGFSFYRNFNGQFTYAVFLYSKPQDVFE